MHLPKLKGWRLESSEQRFIRLIPGLWKRAYNMVQPTATRDLVSPEREREREREVNRHISPNVVLTSGYRIWHRHKLLLFKVYCSRHLPVCVKSIVIK